jgi:hypothetical protein
LGQNVTRRTREIPPGYARALWLSRPSTGGAEDLRPQPQERNVMESDAAVSEKQTHTELEMENARLQQLVADLLVRNQQLRIALKSAQRAPSY